MPRRAHQRPREHTEQSCYVYGRRGTTGVRPVVAQPQYVCATCRREATAPEFLCDPRKL